MRVLRKKSPAVDLPLRLGFSVTSFHKAHNEDAQKTQSHSKKTYLKEIVGQAHHHWKCI